MYHTINRILADAHHALGPSLWLGLVILLGLCLGSFATAMAHRIPLGKKLTTERSHCPHCQHSLGVKDLFPLFSYLLQRGKCRYCRAAISPRYPLTELCTALLIIIIYLKFSLTVLFFILMAYVTTMVILTLIDFEHYIIPDRINLTLLIIAIIYRTAIPTDPAHYIFAPLLGLAIGYGLRWLMFVWKKCEGLGLGDVKFMAAAAMFLDIELITAFLFLSGVIGIIIGIAWNMLGKGREFPFGPALSLALYLCLVMPEFNYWWENLATGWVHKH